MIKWEYPTGQLFNGKNTANIKNKVVPLLNATFR